MGAAEIKDIEYLVPFLIKNQNVWSSYDKETDTLYLHFKKPNHSDNSEMTNDDVIIRYEQNEVIGLTILNASKKGIK
ncbi:MAG: DUF2283 domain-containing protein [Bacteroidota bacterium]